MSLQEAYKATRILETFDNYSRADQINSESTLNLSKRGKEYLYDESLFWKMLLSNPSGYWGVQFSAYDCILSEWVPRVPGLFWAQGSKAIRDFAEKEIATNRPGYIEYSPIGKSQKVLGGVGTIKLPPDLYDNRLFTISFNGNTSLGIPIIISQEIIEQKQLKSGSVIHIENSSWEKMTTDWASQFPSIAGIPRGFLKIEKVDDVLNSKIIANHEIHPFSIMEYQSSNSLFFDFVFVTSIVTKNENRNRIEDFFETYRKKEGRNGKYLFSCDIANPLFESKYSSPFEMRSDYESGQMRVLEARIKREYFNGHTIDQLMQKLPGFYQTAASIRTLVSLLELPVGLLRDDSAAKMSTQLIEMCIDNDKMEQLIDRIAIDHPNAFTN